MAAPEAAQDKRRQTHGSTESCHERWELLTEELPGAQSPARPLSQQAEGVQGTSQPHQGPNTGQGGKENQTLHEATHSEGSTHQQRMAVCKLWTNQLDDAQGVSPVPQNAPRSLQPCAPQGGGHGIHGPSPHHLGGCRQGQIGPRVRQDHTVRQARPRPVRRSPSRTGTRTLRTPRWLTTKEPSQPFPKDAGPQGQPESPNDGAESHPATGNSTRGQGRSSNSQADQSSKTQSRTRGEAPRGRASGARQSHGDCRCNRRARKRKARSHPKRPNHRPWLSLYHLQQGAVCRTPRVFALLSEKHGHRSRRKGKSKTALQRKSRGHRSHPGSRTGGDRHSTEASQAHRVGGREACQYPLHLLPPMCSPHPKPQQTAAWMLP